MCVNKMLWASCSEMVPRCHRAGHVIARSWAAVRPRGQPLVLTAAASGHSRTSTMGGGAAGEDGAATYCS